MLAVSFLIFQKYQFDYRLPSHPNKCGTFFGCSWNPLDQSFHKIFSKMNWSRSLRPPHPPYSWPSQFIVDLTFTLCFYFYFLALKFFRKIIYFSKILPIKKFYFLHKIKWVSKWSHNFSYFTYSEIELFSKKKKISGKQFLKISHIFYVD